MGVLINGTLLNIRGQLAFLAILTIFKKGTFDVPETLGGAMAPLAPPAAAALRSKDLSM